MSKMIIIDRSKKFLQFFDKENETRKVDFLVLHHIEASSIDHALEQFQQHQVSSHFLIDEDGKIFELVDENDVAWHAGISYWSGVDGLNKNSIGIEFINPSPFTKKFEERQMQAGVELCKYLIKKYNIKPQNIVGHSDIAYVKETGILDRKQDPSHLFDWKFLARRGVGIFPEKISATKKNSLKKTKEMLQKFGYRVTNLNDDFDHEMQALTRVFNRRFLGKDSDIWDGNSQGVLKKLISKHCLRNR